MKTLIVGIGNLLRADDGVGIHVIDALRKEDIGDKADLTEDITGFDILVEAPQYDRVILIDAIRSGGEPGTIYTLTPADLRNKQTLHSFSTHLNMDLSSMLELGKTLSPGKMPQDIIIIAIEADDTTTISDKCGPAVEGVIPRVVVLIKSLLS